MRTLATRWLIVLLAIGFAQRGAAQAPTPEAAKARETTNSIGMRLVLIPAGEFLMGGQEPAEELVKAFAAYNRKAEYFHDEYPRHRVRITKPFYFGRTEVTVGQFRTFVEQTGYKTQAETDGRGGWGYNAALGRCEGRDTKYSCAIRASLKPTTIRCST